MMFSIHSRHVYGIYDSPIFETDWKSITQVLNFERNEEKKSESAQVL